MSPRFRRFLARPARAISLLLVTWCLASCSALLLPLAATQEAVNSLTEEEAATALSPEMLALTAFLLNSGNSGSGGCGSYDWGLPAGVPLPVNPADNCTTDAKVELGRLLFYDKRLSGDESMSCASCHDQQFAFTDRLARPQGITGETHDRNSQHLSNTAYHTRLTWANSSLISLETQAAVPIFAESGPSTIVELGTTDLSFQKIQSDSDYETRFAAVFGGGTENITERNIRRALAAFQRTMLSFDSNFDRAQRGETTLSASARRGQLVFNGEVAECFHCHGGFNFTDTSFHSTSFQPEFAFHNNALYSAAEYAAMTQSQRGLVDVTGDVNHEGLFRAPSLRNVALTFPYMHDGSITCDAAHMGDDDACATNALEKVVAHYMSGGKSHPTVDTTLIRSFTLTTQETTDLVEFLKSLSDSTFTNNPALSNPRPGDANFGP